MTSIDRVTDTRSLSHDERRISRSDIKTLALSGLGGGLEFYDFVIFIYFTATISKLFFPAEMPEWLRQFETFGIFATGYLARPIGGILLAHFGDLIGRKRMFSLSIFLMAMPCLCIGLLPTYSSIGVAAPLLLLLLRVLQGAALGGEVPAAWVFVAEHVASRKVGFATAIMSSGIMIGAGIGSVVAYGIHATYSAQEVADFGWRVAFVIGGVFGLIAVFLRRWLAETPVFEELRRRGALAKELPLLIVLREHKKPAAVLMILTWVFSSIVVGVSLMAPTLLQSHFHFDANSAFLASAMGTVVMSVGFVCGGVLFDSIGVKSLLIAGPIYGVTYFIFFSMVKVHPEALFPLYALATFGSGWVVGLLPPLCVPSFPSAVRFSGFSFAYNVAYAIFGSVTPFAIIGSLKYDFMGPAYYIASMGLLTAIVGLFCLASGFTYTMTSSTASAG
jgi:MFS family permease